MAFEGHHSGAIVGYDVGAAEAGGLCHFEGGVEVFLKRSAGVLFVCWIWLIAA